MSNLKTTKENYNFIRTHDDVNYILTKLNYKSVFKDYAFLQLKSNINKLA